MEAVVGFSKLFCVFEKPISDQLKRDVFVEGSAASASKLVQRGRGWSVMVMEYFGVSSGSVIDNVFVNGAEKSKPKGKVVWLDGDDGVVGGVLGMKGLQLVHAVL